MKRCVYISRNLEKVNLIADGSTALSVCRDATPASVKAFVAAQLAPNARVVVYGVPGKQDLGRAVPTPAPVKVAAGTGAESVNADEAWRKDPPKPGASRSLQLPVPSTFQLANGLTVLLNERPGLPVVSAKLVVKK